MRDNVNIINAQLKAAEKLADRLEDMVDKGFAPPVVRVYNPLIYAWEAFKEYVTRYGGTKKRVLFLGMNPGPWGMAQTGVPFGEIAVVRDWLGISAPVGRPVGEHPGYPVDGYACRRSEVSGKRLWGLFMRRYGTSDAFFAAHFVVNYCPLLFIAGSADANDGGRAHNLTPDRLQAAERAALCEVCDEHLRAIAEALRPEFLVGVGNFAATRAEAALKGLKPEGSKISIGKILHPSPASPQSRIDWGGRATRQLEAQRIW
jgi:single-strand selective monofunctional uracil DNA glycosylase